MSSIPEEEEQHSRSNANQYVDDESGNELKSEDSDDTKKQHEDKNKQKGAAVLRNNTKTKFKELPDVNQYDKGEERCGFGLSMLNQTQMARASGVFCAMLTWQQACH